DASPAAQDVVRGLAAHLSVLVADEVMAHVDPEPRDAAVEPEAEDVVECVAHSVVEPVEVRLLHMEGVEVPTAVALCPCRPAEHARAVAGIVRPDVPIALRRVGKPGMLVARVPGDEVEDDLDPE